MRSLATQATSALALLSLCAAPALASRDVFLGWSPDNSYFVKSGQEAKKDIAMWFCSEDEKPTWPVEVGALARDGIVGAPGTCAEVDLPKGPIGVQKTKQLVKARPSRKGPKGETVSIRFVDAGDGSSHIIAVLTSGKMKIERETGYDVGNDNQRPTTKMTDVFWRPDGKQVALYIDTNPAKEQGQRWAYVWNFANDLEKAEQVTKAGKAK